MKRLLLILAFYVLASVGVQAQVVGEDSIKVLWNIKPEANIYGVNFSSDGNRVLNAEYDEWSNGTVIVNKVQQRSIETGEVIKEYEAKRPGKFSAFDVSKDGKYIAFSKLGTNDSIITILDQNTLEFVKDIKIDRGKILNGFQRSYIQALKISPDSKYIVAAIYINTYIDVPNEGCTVVYDLESGEYVDEITYSMNFEGSFHILDYSSDGKYLAGAASWSYMDQNEETVRKSETIIFDTKTWSPVFREEKPCLYIQFSPDGSYLTISYYKTHDNNEIKLFNIAEKFSKTYNMNVTRAFLTEDNNYLIGKKVLDIYNNNIYSLEKWVDVSPLAFDEENSLLLVTSPANIKLLHFNINSLITSISQDDENLAIFPNPAENYIEISLSNKGLQPFANSDEIEIYDVLGERVPYVSTSVNFVATSAGGGQIKIDVSHLPRGVYFVRIGNRTEKFVKE